MSFYIGWGLVGIAGILVLVVIFSHKSTDQEFEFSGKNVSLVAVIGLCYVVGCLMLGKYHIEYLYAINTIAAGKFLVTMITGKPWR